MMTKEEKPKRSMDFTQLFIYFISVNKYRFCILVIGYINMQIIGISYKKSISVDHYSKLYDFLLWNIKKDVEKCSTITQKKKTFTI